MSTAGAGDQPGWTPSRPDAREQIGGLSFALLLLSPELVITEANPAAESLIGVSARRLLGQPLARMVSFDQPQLAERIGSGEAQLVARGVSMRCAGRTLVVNLTVSPLPSHTGWRVLTMSDAGQGDRMGEGDGGSTALRGPAILAHEIKNPLSAIRGAAQLLARRADEREAAWTRLIADEVDRIAQLIDRMQRLGRERVEPVAPTNLHAAIHRAYETVRLTCDDTVSWREEFDPSLPPVLANDGALVQVLINLMANARDASASSVAPQIVVQTRFLSGLVYNAAPFGQPIRLPIEVRISDNGPGIDPALRDHIFEPFVTSKPHGQGLGLALVRKLLRDMNGRISHERDEQGGWTHFRVHLPVAS